MLSFLAIRLGSEEFGIDIANVVEIFKSKKIHEVPEMEEYIAGVINVRGEVITLVDMRKRLGLKPSPIKERTVLVRTNTETLGLIVDEVIEILNFEKNEISKPPTIFKGLASKYLIGLGKREARVIILLNLDNIISREERIKLEVTSESMQDTG